jgi:hypothetical protein
MDLGLGRQVQLVGNLSHTLYNLKGTIKFRSKLLISYPANGDLPVGLYFEVQPITNRKPPLYFMCILSFFHSLLCVFQLK